MRRGRHVTKGAGDGRLPGKGTGCRTVVAMATILRRQGALLVQAGIMGVAHGHVNARSQASF